MYSGFHALFELGKEADKAVADWGKRLEVVPVAVSSQFNRDWSNSIASLLIEWLLTVSLMILLTLASKPAKF